jgi:Calpain family cysteine protease
MSQDFHVLQRSHLKTGKLFEDPDFKTSKETYGFEDYENVKWMRPAEICGNPQFELDGISRFNVKQGGLSDCWFLAALSSLAENEKLFRKVVPKYNDSDFKRDYTGIFHF